MHDLQLVGFTTDRRGLIFRTREGARSEASFVVPVTDELVELVTRLAGEQAASSDADGVTDGSDVAAPAVARPSEEPSPRPRSQLSVRDIQARLRAGESVSRIATEAGVEEDWIERFSPPVRAEQQRIVERALDCRLRRPRSAPSAVPLRRAVGMALADKGIAYTVAAYEAGWSARLLGHDRWAVTFTYHHRGRERRATWAYDASEDALTTTDRAASQLGYVAPDRAAEDDEGDVVEGIVGDPAATAARSTTPEVPASAETRAAPKKTAPKKTAPKKKTATRKTPARKTAARKTAAKQVATKKETATKKTATKKTATTRRAAAAKPGSTKSVGEQRAVATRTEAATRPTPTEPAAPTAEAAPVGPRRPAPVPNGTAPVTDGTRIPGTNGRARPDAPRSAEPASSDPTSGYPGAEEVDPTSARRARAAQRNAPTVHFRSGSAAPVRRAAGPQPPRPGEDRPAARDDRPRPDRRDATEQREPNGAARPATRRRRQLRAR